ncbi:MAG: DUF4333 domain-containing protein [Actinomycetia bacterium]|nr:DUF4333 domain-containing protein [Actinomycetes bacterium]
MNDPETTRPWQVPPAGAPPEVDPDGPTVAAAHPPQQPPAHPPGRPMPAGVDPDGPTVAAVRPPQQPPAHPPGGPMPAGVDPDGPTVAAVRPPQQPSAHPPGMPRPAGDPHPAWGAGRRPSPGPSDRDAPPGGPGTYAGFGAPMAPVSRDGRRFKALLGGGVAVVVAAAAVAITALWVPGFGRSTTLDVNAVQDALRRVLTDPINGYGAQNVTDITCNDGANPPVRTGDTFTCSVTIDDQGYQVTATFTDDTGAYVIGRPH